jgi:hypothetical protein
MHFGCWSVGDGADFLVSEIIRHTRSLAVKSTGNKTNGTTTSGGVVMNKKHRYLLITMLSAGLIVSMPSAQAAVTGDGQDPNAATGGGETRTTPRWGTSTLGEYQVSSSGCAGRTDAVVMSSNGSGWRYKTAPAGAEWLDCPMNLPAGAQIDSFEVLAYDNSDTGNVWGWLFICTGTSDSCTTYGDVQTAGTAAAPYRGWLYSNVAASNIYVNKYVNGYYMRVRLDTSGASNRFREVNVYYRLRVSPAPVSATFSDVPTNHFAFQYVEALASSGITSGCGGSNFCPDVAVTRAQMAVFLSRALGLHFPY